VKTDYAENQECYREISVARSLTLIEKNLSIEIAGLKSAAFHSRDLVITITLPYK
jgi:hypothetical protein